MSWRRVAWAFAITFVCTLTVITVPQLLWKTVTGAVVQNPAQDTTKAEAAPTAPLPQEPAAP